MMIRLRAFMQAASFRVPRATLHMRPFHCRTQNGILCSPAAFARSQAAARVQSTRTLCAFSECSNPTSSMMPDISSAFSRRPCGSSIPVFANSNKLIAIKNRCRRHPVSTSTRAIGSGGLSGEPRGAFSSMEILHENLLKLTGDPLEAEGGRIVIYRGNLNAKLMVVGEAPGAEEDRLGKPFVGRSGELLDKILAAVDLNSEEDAYITNIVKRRPPGNRDPTEDELQYYLPWLKEEIQLLDPQVILLMGRIPMKAVLGEQRGITKVRGEWYTRDGRNVMPMFHPSYLLRNPDRRPGSPRYQTWEDIQEVRKVLVSEKLLDES